MKPWMWIVIFSIICAICQYKFVGDGSHFTLGIAMFISLYIASKMGMDGDSSKHGEDSSF